MYTARNLKIIKKILNKLMPNKVNSLISRYNLDDFGTIR